MTHPNDMTEAHRVVQDELIWLDEQDYTGLSGNERRNIFANHLVMCLDTAGFTLANSAPDPMRVRTSSDSGAQS